MRNLMELMNPYPSIKMKTTIFCAVISYIIFLLLYTFTLSKEILINNSYCFSPKKLVMNFHIFSIFTSMFYPPTILIAIIDFINLFLFLLILYISYTSTRLIYKFFLYILVTHILTIVFRTLISTILYFFLPWHLLLITHLFHDCSGGITTLISYPSLIFCFSLSRDLTSTLCQVNILLMTFISLLSIFLYFENCITMLLSLIMSLIVSTIFLKKPYTYTPMPHQFEESYKTELEKVNYFNYKFNGTFSRNFFKKAKNYQGILTMIIIVGSLLARSYGMKNVQYFHSTKETRPLKLGIIISSVERPTKSHYLTRTLDSIISQLPTFSNYSETRNFRIYAILYENPTIFNRTGTPINERIQMEPNQMSQNYLKFVNGTEALHGIGLDRSRVDNMSKVLRLKRHVSAGLKFGSVSFPEANWLMIHEDDFILCPRMLHWLMNLVKSIDQTKFYCGIFVATGGAGILVRREVVDDLLTALMDPNIKEPADVLIQNCLRGRYKTHCLQCHQPNTGLLISSHLVFEHIGFVSSMNHHYSENQHRWSCGWTHPFNNDPDVDIRFTDTLYI